MTQTAKGPPTVQTAYVAFKKLVGDQFCRIDTMYSEVARHEKQGITQVNNAIDELAKLAKDSVDCARQFSEEWRKLVVEGTQRVGEMWNTVLVQ